MLDFLRRNSSSVVIQVIFAIIVVVFIFWGVGSSQSNASRAVAVVNGVEIKDGEFSRAYRSEVYRQKRYRELKDADLERIRAEIIDQLISREVLAQEARRQGVVVSDHELRKEITDMPAFRGDDGKFSPDKYREVLKNNNTEDARFEADLRGDLMVRRLQDLIRRSVTVSPDEVLEDFRKRSEQVNLEFVRINPSLFKDKVDTGEAATGAWLAANSQKAQERYDSRFETEYNKPRGVKALHILLRSAEGDDEALKAKVKAKADELHTRALTEDFAELARQYSEDFSARKGGDVGWVDEKRAGAPYGEEEFKKAMATLEAGKVSEVIPTSQGYEIVKAVEIREPKTVSFEEARKDIAKELMVEEEGPKQARALADSLVKDFAAGASIEGKTAGLDLKVQETGDFNFSEDRVPRLGQSPELAQVAFTLRTPGQGPQQVFDVGGSMVIVRLKSRQEADMSAFEKEKASATDQLLLSRQGEAMKGWIDNLKASATIERMALSGP